MGVEGHLCMVFNCFLDDSKDRDQSKIFVSAGYIGKREDWVALRLFWNQTLQEHGIRYFKTSEWEMLRGEFAKFRTSAYPSPEGRNHANKIRESLLGVPRMLKDIQGFGCAIPMDDYNRVCDRPEAKEFFTAHPYRRALDGMFNEVCSVVLPAETRLPNSV
jgi:hypothetical protein